MEFFKPSFLFGISPILKKGLFQRFVEDRVKSSFLFKVLTKTGVVGSREPEAGDVIYCVRYHGAYRHFGIYAGNGRVIHFAPPGGDIGGQAYIHEVSIQEFADGSEVHILEFSDHYESNSLLRKIAMSDDYELQTPENTVKRARSKIGKKGVNDDGYHLIMNNCEDFAIWCKTNVFESKQVNDFIDSILP